MAHSASGTYPDFLGGARYLARNYHPLEDLLLVRGEGVWVYDTEGRKYLDFMSAYSANTFGHNHPRIVAAAMEQLKTLGVTSRAFDTVPLYAFAQAMHELTGMDRVLPGSGGAESVETAIKAARRWGYKVKGIPKDKAEIIVCYNNFHGRSTTIISFSSEPSYQEGFGPLTPGFRHVPFGDARALEAAITPNTAAFLVEPMQGEAGIIIPPEGYLKEISAICKKHKVLLILDEIQTGMGRTGKTFAFEHEGIRPDGLIVGKALGGGQLPVSAFLASEEVMGVFTPGSHGSTFGGNPLACAVAIAATQVLREEKLAEHSAKLGDYLISQLKSIKSPLISDIRGKGLFIGVEINPAFATARQVCERLKELGILSKETHETVVRFAPPLIVTKEQVDMALGAFAAALAELEKKKKSA